MTKSKSFNKSPKHRALYHALMELILEDKNAMDKGRQRTSKGTETSKNTSTSKDSSKGKTLTTSSKSRKSAKDQVEEPIFMQDSDYAKHDDAEFDNTDMPMDHGEYLGKTNEQPNDEAVPKNDWYKKSRSGTSPDLGWNEGKLVDDGPEQSWLNDLAKATKPPFTFDELMHTPIDFYAFAMNRLKIDKLTKEHLVGPNNPKGRHYPYDLTKPVLVQMSSQGHQIVLTDFFCNNNLEYLRGGSNDKKNIASTTKYKAARNELKDIEDMVPNIWSTVKLGVESYQKKHNLTKPRTQDADMSRRPAYTTLSNPQGVIYEDKLK
ncbi:hypothetical protein Tco_0629961 [Tanacetum coccineum]|uniref:PiggyBac transposable element-derived protein domain-containing protein n=1 Tax=Tanacetum coccineum TaxID=301880 RepID=A0ABQ4WUP5_9ASTR